MKTNSKRLPVLPLLVIKFGLMLLFTILVFFTAFAQQNTAQNCLNKRITLTVKDEQITKVIDQLKPLINVDVIYNPKTIQANRRISFSVTDQAFQVLLDTYFLPLGIYYKSYPQAILLYHYLEEVQNMEQPKTKRLYMLTPKALGEPE